MMKILTVVIPAYNTELYLARCLDSLLYDESIRELLDIIIVNDGSSDNTLDIAKRYAKKCPASVSVIDKKNGGHGSTINAGVKKAKGKYFKVVDSDDWVNIGDFTQYVKALRDLTADIVVSNYQQDILYDSSSIEFKFADSQSDNIPIKDAAKLIGKSNFFFMFSMHSMTVKTNSLKRVWGDGLLEKTFYVDQIFVAKCLQCAKNYILTSYDIYRYFIGRPEQSMSGDGIYKHRHDHERVLRTLLSFIDSSDKEEYFSSILTYQIKMMLKTHYAIYLGRQNISSKELAELKKFDSFICQKYPAFIQKKASDHLQSKTLYLKRKIKKIL